MAGVDQIAACYKILVCDQLSFGVGLKFSVGWRGFNIWRWSIILRGQDQNLRAVEEINRKKRSQI